MPGEGVSTLSLDLALRYLTWAVYLAVFLLALRRALRTPTPGHRDSALFFGATAVLIVLVTLQTIEGAALPRWLSLGVGMVAMALPYLLLRLVAGFAQTPAWVQRAAEAGLAVAGVVLVLAPDPAPAAVSLLLVAYFSGRAFLQQPVFSADVRRDDPRTPACTRGGMCAPCWPRRARPAAGGWACSPSGHRGHRCSRRVTWSWYSS